MDIIILLLISSIATILTVLSYALPSTFESIYHGARLQKIWLSIFSATFWWVTSISVGNIEYLMSGALGIETVTVDATVITWLFAGLGVMQMLYAIMLIFEHANEEAEEAQKVINENSLSPLEEAEDW